MPATTPTTRYRNIIFDSARWADVELRSGDIIVTTPPKCGTTWTQMLCALLVFDGPELPAPLEQLSPWVDMLDRPIDEVRAVLDGQRHRRVIKSHTPLDGLPMRDDVHYVVVGRDPRDVAISWEHHMANLDVGRFLELRSQVVDPADDWFPPLVPVPDDPADRFRHFLASDAEGEMNLATVLHHLAVGWRHRHLPNVHLVHYADLRRDLPGSLFDLGRRLDFPITPGRAEELAAEASLERMRARAEEVVPSASLGIWRDPSCFIRTGGSGEWRSLATPADEAAYRGRIAELIPADLAAWVHDGRALPSATR